MKGLISVKVTKKQKALVLFCFGYTKTFIRDELKLKAKKLNQWIEEEIEAPCMDEVIKKKALYLYSQKIPKEILCRYIKITFTQLYNWTHTTKTNVRIADYLREDTTRQSGRTNYITQICKKNKLL